MLDVVQIPLGAYRTNCYLVAREGASEAVVIDPGDAPTPCSACSPTAAGRPPPCS